ncbi:uncharacterized protein isoform X4 [Musca autumnalis]|uniref:uncharacterized protein isoform X4 n=1 Tax=Musca autumnalis TaxID=221902 RepID=UPI003CF10571
MSEKMSIKTEPFVNDYKQENSNNDTNTLGYNKTKLEHFTNMGNDIKQEEIDLDKMEDFLPENVDESTSDIIKEENVEEIDEFLPKVSTSIRSPSSLTSKSDDRTEAIIHDEVHVTQQHLTGTTTQQISLPKLEIMDVDTDEDDGLEINGDTDANFSDNKERSVISSSRVAQKHPLSMDTKYICEICNKICTTHHGLALHSNRMHPGTKKPTEHTCEQCEKGRIVHKKLLKMNNIKEINSQDPQNIIGELLEIDGNIVVVRDTSHCSSQDAEYNEDDYMLREFLKGINMESLFEQLKASYVTFRSLQYLKKEDLKEAVPPLGLRVEFREKLFAWKKRELGIDDETISVPSKIGEWWKRNETPASTPGTPGTPHTTVSYGSKAKGILSEDLKELLTHTSKGKLALECSSANKKLSDEQRDDIINIIIEDILTNNVTLYAQDYMRILDEICSVFPLENEMRDYYYISRKGKNNASGKLYAKYRNKKSKKIKLLDSEPSTSKAAAHTSSNLCNNDVPEFDESVENSMKASLLRECNDWGSICEKWKRSFNIRQRDIKSLSSHAFLLEWPKLSDARASEFVNIDFDIMYPQKGNLLLSKWDQFKKKVYNYYGKNIHNDHCKQLFANVLTASSIG